MPASPFRARFRFRNEQSSTARVHRTRKWARKRAGAALGGLEPYTNARIHSGIFRHHGWREASGETGRTPPLTIPLESLGRRTP